MPDGTSSDGKATQAGHPSRLRRSAPAAPVPPRYPAIARGKKRCGRRDPAVAAALAAYNVQLAQYREAAARHDEMQAFRGQAGEHRPRAAPGQGGARRLPLEGVFKAVCRAARSRCVQEMATRAGVDVDDIAQEVMLAALRTDDAGVLAGQQPAAHRAVRRAALAMLRRARVAREVLAYDLVKTEGDGRAAFEERLADPSPAPDAALEDAEADRAAWARREQVVAALRAKRADLLSPGGRESSRAWRQRQCALATCDALLLELGDAAPALPRPYPGRLLAPSAVLPWIGGAPGPAHPKHDESAGE